MATVKKEGNVPLDWKTEVTCERKDKYDSDGCKAVVEILEKDLVLRYFEGTHFTHHYAAVVCPCCGKYNRVNVPDSVWKRLNTSKNRKKATFDGFSESIL